MAREVIYGHLLVCPLSGNTMAPRCCGQPMKDDGECDVGCCDDYRCEICSKRVRVEWPD